MERALPPEMLLALAVGAVLLTNTKADRTRLAAAVEVPVANTLPRHGEDLRTAAVEFLAGTRTLEQLGEASVAFCAPYVAARRPATAGAGPLFSANPTHAALAAEALEER